MNPRVRYQVFVSSTYEDLREERQQATQAILEAGSFPSGMELFPASDDTQWELIKRVIEESDYYVVIVGGRYGALGSKGRSYTEMEYDFAIERGVPVLGFVKRNIGDLPSKYVDLDKKQRDRLNAFREKVLSRTCRKFDDPMELGMAVMKSLMHEARVRPRTGWVRADQARSAEDRAREIKLQEALEDSRSEIETLQRIMRDRSVLADEIPRDRLCQGSDLYEFAISYRDDEKQLVMESVSISWDDIFRTIGPSLYGYIIRKTGRTGANSSYPFQKNLEDVLRKRTIDRVKGRKFEIQEGQIDTCIFQLKELGYIQFMEKLEEDGSVFRGITLTEYGERCLSLLKTKQRSH